MPTKRQVEDRSPKTLHGDTQNKRVARGRPCRRSSLRPEAPIFVQVRGSRAHFRPLFSERPALRTLRQPHANLSSTSHRGCPEQTPDQVPNATLFWSTSLHGKTRPQQRPTSVQSWSTSAQIWLTSADKCGRHRPTFAGMGRAMAYNSLELEKVCRQFAIIGPDLVVLRPNWADFGELPVRVETQGSDSVQVGSNPSPITHPPLGRRLPCSAPPGAREGVRSLRSRCLCILSSPSRRRTCCSPRWGRL